MGAPEKIGIVGAGTMGSLIGSFCIKNGKELYLYDVSPEMLEKAKTRIRDILLKQDIPDLDKVLTRLHLCDDLGFCVKNVDLVLENVPEKLELKRQVFAEIDRLAPPHVVIGTNSSSIPPSHIASATNRPDKFYNANFSTPVVEVMGHAGTSEETLVLVESFLKSIGMVPIRIQREIMGYALNRTWRAIKRETLHLVADGYVHFEDLDRAWMLDFGTKAGPFGLMDKVGLDVVRDIELQYFKASGDEGDRPPQYLEEMILEKRLGVKTGRGFYSYPNPEYERPGWLRKEPPWSPEMNIEL